MSRVARKPKPTLSTNKHVFESFTRRIARLKIDPIHTIKGRTATEEASDLSHSFFRTALEEWSTLNLTTTFTSLLRTVNPLCESLPQLLHHADTIFDCLITHIEKKEPLALEPLLDLTAHFAHDLGREFEKYFERTVSLVAKVAASSERPEVVEWSFTCLAWMFKYLARLLVQDLRPLLHIFRPYLSSRKEHVSRFSAQSLAFLIRKAAILYPKRKAPLNHAISELMEGLQDSSETAQYGIMILLVESCLGVDTELHSSSEYLLRCLLDSGAVAGSEDARKVVQGVLTSIMHQVDATAFDPAAREILSFSAAASLTGDQDRLTLAIDCIQTIAGTRKGLRVPDWKALLQCCLTIAESQQSVHSTTSLPQMQLTFALLLQNAPMDQLLPFSNSILNFATRDIGPTNLFSFCILMADLGQDRFHALVLPRLQRYIATNFAENETGLMYTLEVLHQREAICSQRPRPGFLESTKAWDQSIAQKLSGVNNGENLITAWVAGVSRLPYHFKFPSNDLERNSIVAALRGRIQDALVSGNAQMDLEHRLTAGWSLEAYCALETDGSELVKLREQLLTAPIAYFHLLPFLRACNGIITQHDNSVMSDSTQLHRIYDTLTQNLLATSIDLREQSLLMLQKLTARVNRSWAQQTLDLLIEILRTPYTPSNARTIAMLLRRLPQHQRGCPKDANLDLVIPKFCLGLLSIYHDQSRRDLCRVLAELISDSSLEDTILDTLISWLKTCEPPVTSQKEPFSAELKSSPFQDMAVLQAREAAALSTTVLQDPKGKLVELAQEAHQLHTNRVPARCRSLALSALSEMVPIIERRSKLLTPVFLAAKFNKTGEEGVQPSDTSASSHTLSPEIQESGWSLADRKMFVNLIANFQNPKVLYRSADVYDRLLELLTNGNVDIRKHALAAILKWKDPVLTKHEFILNKIVDEKIPSAEVGIMLNADSEENPIKPSERSGVLPVLLRLIYGLVVGRSGSYGSQESRRRTLLRMLFRMERQEIILFLDIAMGRLKDVRIAQNGSIDQSISQREYTTADQRYGFLRMMSTLMETLQSQFASYAHHVVEAVLYCTLRGAFFTDSASDGANSIERNIRRTGIQCLIMMFENPAEVDWTMYMPTLFSGLVAPRLDNFATENMQGISAVFRLLGAWCKAFAHVEYLTHDSRVLPAVWSVLATPMTKPDVKKFVLDEMLLSLIGLADGRDGNDEQVKTLLQSQTSSILQSLTVILETAPPADLLKSTATVLLGLAPMTTSGEGINSTITLLVQLLVTSKHRLTPLVKASLLEAIGALLKVLDTSLDESTEKKLLGAVSSLFDYFKDKPNRQTLCRILQTLGSHDPSILSSADICSDLNATSTEKLDEVDFDRCSSAFQRIATLPIDADHLEIWWPVLYNLLFFCRDDDFNIRSNAVASLRSFIRRASEDGTHAAGLLHDIVLPSLQKGLTEDSELVRADYVALYGLLVQYLDEPRLANMKPLLMDDDEEASFFANILHIQQHRRLRAIRRLVTEVEQGHISANNVSQVFLPLLQKFIRDPSSDESAQTTKGESLIAMKTLLQWVEWKHFKPVFKQYKTDLEGEDLVQRTAIKMLSQAADAILAASEDRSKQEEDLSHLALTLPDSAVLSEQVKNQLLPKLADFVHYRDEAEMSSRLPAATVAVKLAKLLPIEEGQVVSAPVVLDVANVLKSRAQEARDASRVVLIEIVDLLGPGSVQFVLRQLRSVLQRGYQLHVLSFVLHAMLVRLSPRLELGDLDYCIADLVSVIMDDTFGAVGQEKDNEDYISSMKEVKAKKSFDSMELLARCTSLDHLTMLIQPITTLLTGTLNVKKMRQVDELLRRIGVGLARNPSAGDRGLLVFAYQAIQSFYKEKTPAPVREKTNDERNRERFLLQKSAARSGAASGSLVYKIARFAIDLVRSALVKHNDLLTPENVHGFLPVIGDALVEGQEDVKVSAMRLLSAIIKLRMSDLDENCPIYVSEAVRIVKDCTNTNEEAAQAALKLISAVLRERKTVKVRDSDVAAVLHRITPDLEEPDRQGVTFNFIRAVLARKYELPEVYEVVDKIAVMMVTSQANGARDVARGVYVHFLVEYPQSSSRWTKQQRFLVKNLEYDYFEGRQAVMEAINTLLTKTSGETLQQLVATFFVPIVLRMANDDHEICRELAKALLSQLFLKADQSRITGMLEPLEGWLEQDNNDGLVQLGLQAFSVLFNVRTEGFEKELVLCRTRTGQILSRTADEGTETKLEALRLLTALVQTRPAAVLSSKADGIWKHVRELLFHPSSARTTAAVLVRTFLESCKPEVISRLPLTSSYGLRWDAAAMQELLRACVKIVRSNQSDPEVNAEVLPTLTLLVQIAQSSKLTIPLKPDETTEEENTSTPTKISATQYLLDQMAYTLRREISPPLTSLSFLPKTTALTLLTTLIPILPATVFPAGQLPSLLLPFLHLTSTNTSTPFSTDPAFTTTYEALSTTAQEVMSQLQDKVGDETYITAMTSASKAARERREERRRKRVVEQVADPERAAREKKRKGDRKKERKKEVGAGWSVKRKARGW